MSDDSSDCSDDSSDETSSGESSAASSDGSSSGSEDSGAAGVGGGAMDIEGEAPSGVVVAPRQRRPRKPKALITALHALQPLRKCTHGCGATVWPEEGKLCCSGGKHILGPEYNPPIAPEYLLLLQEPHMSAMSRYLNGALQLGTLSVTPSKSMGGIGFHRRPMPTWQFGASPTWSCMT